MPRVGGVSRRGCVWTSDGPLAEWSWGGGLPSNACVAQRRLWNRVLEGFALIGVIRLAKGHLTRRVSAS